MAEKERGKNKELVGSFSLPSPTASQGKHGIPGVLNIPAAGGFTAVVCRGIGQFPGCASCWKAASGLCQGTTILSQKNVWPRKVKFLMQLPIFLPTFTHRRAVQRKMLLRTNGESYGGLSQSLARRRERSFSRVKICPLK